MKLNVTKKELLNTLNQLADLSEFAGENQFKVRAYRNAVNALRYINDDFEKIIETNELLKVKGIGKGIFATIKEIFENGYSSELLSLKEKAPEGIDDLLQIRGLGIKKLILLNKELQVENLDDLTEVIESGKLSEIKGFGEKSIEKIKTEINRIITTKHLLLLDEAFEVADSLKKEIESFPGVIKVELTGQLRRILEIISRIDLLVLVNENSKKECLDNLRDSFIIAEENIRDEVTVLRISAEKEREIYLHIVTREEEFTKENFLLTGSEYFISKFADLSNNFKSEDEIFSANKIRFVAPEMREEETENILKRDSSPSDLDFPGMKAMLHFHTVYSDGANSLEEMVLSGKENGFEYFAVCDHSKSAFYANGLTEERLIEQHDEITALREKLGVEIFHGIESDILKDGSLDYSDEILAGFDFIIASVHSNFNLSEEEMTARIIKAIESPFSNAIGHPTGRLLLRRDGYKLNIRKILDACAANNTAIEINANPHRLDLDWRNYDYAREKGALFTINADAHATSHIEYTKYGVMIARKGGIKKSEVINYFSLEQFNEFISR